jgi:hypothetical protein
MIALKLTVQLLFLLLPNLFVESSCTSNYVPDNGKLCFYDRSNVKSHLFNFQVRQHAAQAFVLTADPFASIMAPPMSPVFPKRLDARLAHLKMDVAFILLGGPKLISIFFILLK